MTTCLLCVGLTIVWLGLGCSRGGEPASHVAAGNAMSQFFADPDFDSVRPDSTESAWCTPKFERFEGEGIKLNAPTEVYLQADPDPITGAFARVLVCVAARFKHSTLALDGDFMPAIVFVAVDAASHDTYSGRFFGLANRLPPPPPEKFGLTREDLKNRIITRFFNPNLATAVGLPAKEAEYIVYATLGAYKSNVVRIRVTRPGKE